MLETGIKEKDVRVIRIELMMAVMSTLVVSTSQMASAQDGLDGDIWGDPEISVAVGKTRKGEDADLRRLTSKADPRSSWKPVKKNLPKYHECLSTNENPAGSVLRGRGHWSFEGQVQCQAAQYFYRLIHPNSVSASSCHRIRSCQDEQNIGDTYGGGIGLPADLKQPTP